jgi:hypothetical protein
MSTPIWQPVTWVIFHSISKNYKEEYHPYYIRFFETFKTIIPCKMCRTHYNENLNKENLTIESNVNSQNIFNWTINLHNIVNKQNHKRQWSYERANDHYGRFFLNNNLIKLFMLEYLKANFRKGPEKTEKLIMMFQCIPYLHPNEEKRRKLIDFKEKFDLRPETMKNWLYAFLLILKS